MLAETRSMNQSQLQTKNTVFKNSGKMHLTMISLVEL